MTSAPRVVTGVILAGGAAHRFAGDPKGLTRVAGRRIIDRVAAALRPATDRLLLLANDPRADGWLAGVPAVGDLEPGGGSLEGIRSALLRAGTDVLVVAWDMPFVATALLSALRSAAADGAPAVLPEGPHGVEPLCAFYAASCLPVADELLAAGERRARALAARVGAVSLPADQVARCGDPRILFHNVNRPADLAAARGFAEAAGAAAVVARQPGAASA